LPSTHVPLIRVDIWVHAFYLQFKNVKPDVHIPYHLFGISNYRPPEKLILQHLAAIWHVINFREAEKRLLDAKSKL